MAQKASPGTLFHLIPQNDAARETLGHPDNRRFVSLSLGKNLGLEVGFHVAAAPGRVMARLGRNADLVLQHRNVSAVHVSLEIHPETFVVLLSTRAKRASSVVIKPVPRGPEDSVEGENAIQGDDTAEGDEAIEGDCVLSYGTTYSILIADYSFRLVWRPMDPAALRELAIEEYSKAAERQAAARSRYLPTEADSEAHTWHNTRIHTTQRPLFVEAKGVPRFKIGGGEFGDVYRVVDDLTGNTFAVKAIKLEAYGDPEHARSLAHREVKALQQLKHVCRVFLRLRPVPFVPVNPTRRSMLSSFSAMASGIPPGLRSSCRCAWGA